MGNALEMRVYAPLVKATSKTDGPSQVAEKKIVRCGPCSFTRRAICCAVVLGFVVMAVLMRFVTRYDLPDYPPGSQETVLSIGPFNAVAAVLWVCLFVLSRLFRPKRLILATASFAWIITAFWLVCFFVCCILTHFFRQKAKEWPNVQFPEDEKEGIPLHNFHQLKAAQAASISSAVLSFCVFVIWAVVAKYRMQDWRTVRGLADDLIRTDDALPEDSADELRSANPV
eukprot:c6463_g1_i1.p1 GENE.c6463_g1_i1~~c6463_g1_i1.p1  ORF type:complete len:228 (+),score=42.82 c6463_g1_i1:1-684(+)